jgi:hypothetical protein
LTHRSSRNFHYSERIYAQFRAEFFDTTNTPSFTFPAANDVTLTCQGAPRAARNVSQLGMNTFRHWFMWPAIEVASDK